MEKSTKNSHKIPQKLWKIFPQKIMKNCSTKKSWKCFSTKIHRNFTTIFFFKKIEKGRIQFETEFMESKFPVKLGLLFVHI